MTTLLSETLRADIAEEVKGLIMIKKRLNVDVVLSGMHHPRLLNLFYQ
jgi:hypothetical protein